MVTRSKGSCQLYSVSSALEKCMRRAWVGCKIDVSNEMSWSSGKDMGCTEGEAARIDGS
jgi:hypothetical protein